MTTLETLARAMLVDLRDRKLLNYLFDSDPENCDAYGYVVHAFDLETQREITESLALAVLRALIENPSPEMIEAGDGACVLFGPDGEYRDPGECRDTVAAIFTAMLQAVMETPR